MEPERQIEKLLRASAKKRRDEAGAPRELHPATRRLLQAEIARRARKADEGNFFLTLAALLRRKVVFALCAVAVCAVAVAMLLPSLSKTKSRTTVAFNANKRAAEADQPESKSAMPAEARKAAQSVVAERPAETAISDKTRTLAMNRGGEPTVAADTIAAGEKKVDDQPGVLSTREVGRFGGGGRGGFGGGGGGGFGRSGIAQEQITVRAGSSGSVAVENTPAFKLNRNEAAASRTSSPALALAPASTSTGATPLKDADTRRTAELAYSVNTNAPTIGPSGTVAVAESSNLSRGIAGSNFDALGNQQNFVNIGNVVPPQAQAFANSGTKLPVLNNFNVSNRGAELQIVDEDGSVYSGYVQSTNILPTSVSSSGATGDGTLAAKPAANQSVALAGQNYYFVVNGTNQSLKQNVRFSGNLVVSGNEAQQNLQNNNIQLQNRLQIAASNLLIVPLANYRINGTAELGRDQKFDIEAVPSTSRQQ